MSKTVLVIEDEPDVATAIGYVLREAGYRVITTPDGLTGLERAGTDHPDVVLLDLRLPGMDGMEVCSVIRAESDVPIIMLTARRGEDDHVDGLTQGADDYITKPFRAAELRARVAAVLRRCRRWSRGGEPIQVGDLCLDPAAREVRIRGQPVHLTPREFGVLERLARNAGSAISARALLGVCGARTNR